jgi:asparagine synthase (glutamine-hydrolysing)
MHEEYENLAPLEQELFYPRLREVFQKILPKYFDTDSNGSIAFSLTGGMDTRTVLANINRPLLHNTRSYTHSGAYRECYDVTIAREVAKVCGLSHDTLRLDERFIANFPALAEKTVYVTDGYMDLNGTPSLYLHGKARQVGDIRFTGNFGDQVLVHRINLKPSSDKLNFLNHDFVTFLSNANKRLKDISVGHPLTFFLFKQAPWLDYSRFSMEHSQMVQRTPFMDNELISLLYQSPAGLLDQEDVRRQLVIEGNPNLAKIFTEKGHLGDWGPLASQYLRFYRRYLFKAEYYFSYGMPHWLARLNNTLRFLHFENLLLERNKYYNFRKLFRHELANFVRDILLDRRTLTRPFINKKYVEKMVIDHTCGRGNYTNEINLMLTTELTFRQLIEK